MRAGILGDTMDHGLSIDEVHEMLDAVERSLTKLRSANLYNKAMPVSFIGDGVSVIYELEGAGILNSVGISSSILNKLKNLDGRVSASVMTAALERLRTFLRRLESEFGGSTVPEDDTDERLRDLDTMVERHPPKPVAAWTEQWVYVPPRSKAKALIAELSELLDELVLIAKSTNLPEDQAALTDIDRAQLVALLETTLAVFKAPMVEPGLLKKLQRTATDAAMETIKSKTELALGEGLSAVAARLLELLQLLV
jgi:hypothetical protein